MFTPGLVVAVHSLLWHVAVSTTRTDKYVRITLCGISQLTSLTLSAEPGLTKPVRPLACADLCSRRLDCIGFSIESQASCFTLTIWPKSTDTCTVEDQTFNTYLRTTSPLRSCLNGGVWDSAKDSCMCSGGRVGVYCDRYAISCTELNLFGYPVNMRFAAKLQPPSFSEPFPVTCVLNLNTGQSRLLLSLSKIGGLSFNRSWEEYKTGFYSDGKHDGEEEYWIGLEKAHYFTTSLGLNHLRITVDISDINNLQFKYSGFTVDDEASKFQASYTSLTYSNIDSMASYVSGDLGTCFEPDAKTPFSTPDTDNDGDPGTHCANQSGAGWWFSSGCLTTKSCNPFGEVYQLATDITTNMHVRFPGLDMRSIATNLQRIKVYLIDQL